MNWPLRKILPAIVALGFAAASCGGHPAVPPMETVTPTATATATESAALATTRTPTLTPAVTPAIVPPEPQPGSIVIGRDYSYYLGTPEHDQATVEFMDITDFREKILAIKTSTNGYPIRIGLYRGKVDLERWWGDSAPFVLETDFNVNASAEIYIYPSDTIVSIVYITRPVALETPEFLEITRALSFRDSDAPMDLSQPFVTDFWTFPDSIFRNLRNPVQFNENMNREYSALKDLLGRDSDALDLDGHIHLIVQDIDYCGLAGNPIRMDPDCMSPEMLNTGNPGWGPVHELGHDFIGPASFCWGDADSSEGWANFMAYYAYDNRVFFNNDYDSGFWANVWDTSPKMTDIFQGEIVRVSHENSWEVARVFIRKYLAADPARDLDDTEKMRQAVRYLADSALEVSGDQAEFDSVVSFLVGKGFPQP